MLCSGAELGLGDDHDGIIDLPGRRAGRASPTPLYAGLDDPVIEINLTPNRPDCTSVHGIARDLAAAGLGTPEARAAAGRCAARAPARSRSTLDFAPADRDLCPALRPAPRARRQERPVAGLDAGAGCARSACARSTRSSTSPTTSPSTAAGRCTSSTPPRCGATSTVRRARDGEEPPGARRPDLRARPTTPWSSPTRTASNRSPASWAARHSGCDEGTTDVLIESALWDPLNIAQTGPPPRHHHRCALPLRARRRPGLHAAGPRPRDAARPRPLRRRRRPRRRSPASCPETERVIDFPWTEVRRLAGLELPRAEMKVILEALGFHVAGTGRPGEGAAARPGGPTSRARPTSSRRSCASPASTGSSRSPCRGSSRRSASRC